MKGRRTGGVISRFLYRIGEKVRFAPDTSFAPARSEKNEKTRLSFFLPYRQQFQNAMAKMREQSFLLDCLSSFYRNLFSTRIRSFALLFFTAGFLQILFFFLGNRVSFFTAGEETLLFGVSEIFIAILCAFTRGDLENSLKKSFLFTSLIRPLFGVNPWCIPTGRKHDSTFPMILFGAFFALLSVLFTPMKVLLFLLILAFTLFVFYLPEAGLYVAGLLFFLIPSAYFTLLIFLTLVSFFCKWAIGKRSISLSYCQKGFLFLLALFFFTGKDNLSFAFQIFSLFFLTSSLIRTTASLRRFLFSLVLGTIICAGKLCLSQIVAFPSVASLFYGMDLDFLFADVSSYTGVFLVLMIPLALGLFRSMRWGGKMILFPILFLISVAALSFIGSSVLWNALFLSLLLFGFFSYRSFLITLLVLAMSFVTTITLFPDTVGQKMISFFAKGESSSHLGLFSVLHQKWGLVFWLGLLILVALFVYRVYRFKKDTTRPAVYPLVLGIVVSVAVFLYLGLSPISVTRHFVMFFITLLSLPEVAYISAVREEIRLPY